MFNAVVDVESQETPAPQSPAEQAPPAAERPSTIRLGREFTEIPSLPDSVAKDLVQLFKLFADETRLRILYFLMQREELNVRALCSLLKQSQPAVSHHLALLRVAGLIECRR